MPDQGQTAAGATATEYEFDKDQNLIIREVAGTASAWGVISMIIGVGSILATIIALGEKMLSWVYLPVGLASLLVGGIFIGVGASLRRVVRTEGHDIKHLMAAMRRLSSAFIIQIIATALGYAISFAMGLIGF